MTEAKAEGAAMVAMLLSLPLVSWGSTEDLPAFTSVRDDLLARMDAAEQQAEQGAVASF